MALVLTIATVAAGVAGAVQQRNAGIIQSNELKAQARVEGDAAKGREIDRRRNLIRALASQNASAGSAGVELGGSIGGIIQTDIRNNQQDLLTDAAGTSARQRDLAIGAKNARSQGNLGAVTSLLDTAGSAIKTMPAPKPKLH